MAAMLVFQQSNVIVERSKSEAKQCNCRKKEECPVAERCKSKSVIYEATVTTNDGTPDQTYIGLTATTCKTKYNNHKTLLALKG
jgi:hypothetical protein